MAELQLIDLGMLLVVTSLVAMMSRRIGLPYTAGLVAAGIVLALLPIMLAEVSTTTGAELMKPIAVPTNCSRRMSNGSESPTTACAGKPTCSAARSAPRTSTTCSHLTSSSATPPSR